MSVLIIGETIIDIERIVRGRTTLEQPLPEYGSWETIKEINTRGGSSNIAKHVNILSRDSSASVILGCEQFGIDITKKERWFDENGKKLIKCNSSFTSNANTEYALKLIQSEIFYDDIETVIIIDMERRIFNKKIADFILSTGKQIFVDVQGKFGQQIDYSIWEGAILFPNRNEEKASQLSYTGQKVYAKDGANGVYLFDNNEMRRTPLHIEGIDVTKFGYSISDTTGAGDAFIAAMSVLKNPYAANRYAAFCITDQAHKIEEDDFIDAFEEFERKVLENEITS